jgi:hypothetical protein
LELNRYVGNLVPLPGVFPDYEAPIVRNGAEGRELAAARWGTPSPRERSRRVLTILSAAVAGLGNAFAIMLNGSEQRELERIKSDQARTIEETKAEAARIFEVIKTGNPAQAATNLKFLVDVGLISDAGRRESIKALGGEKLPALPFIPTTPPVDWRNQPPLPQPPPHLPSSGPPTLLEPDDG